MPKNKKTDIEQYVINRIKEIRIEKGFSQEDIASALDFTRGFIGQIESPNNPAKYNLNHLNILAKELNCSPKDFLPDMPLIETRKKKTK
ncbi:MAG: helix-turn-helix transcriptional regulator [Bacteroidetes bacterium]|nr:helix-turn-helix transcriptional regulator [Bacteroidota bacterium]